MIFSQLNVQSKYVLEKIKLKKVLQNIHREINWTGVALKLKGGIDTEILEMNFKIKNENEEIVNIRKSVKLSELLESKTFL